jgi:hypothetical protein
MPTVNGPDEITDLEAGNDKVFYSDSSGDVTELALGASGTVLTSAGATSAPSWVATAGGAEGSFTAYGSIAAGRAVVLDAAGTVSQLANTLVSNAAGDGTTNNSGYGWSSPMWGMSTSSGRGYYDKSVNHHVRVNQNYQHPTVPWYGGIQLSGFTTASGALTTTNNIGLTLTGYDAGSTGSSAPSSWYDDTGEVGYCAISKGSTALYGYLFAINSSGTAFTTSALTQFSQNSATYAKTGIYIPDLGYSLIFWQNGTGTHYTDIENASAGSTTITVGGNIATTLLDSDAYTSNIGCIKASYDPDNKIIVLAFQAYNAAYATPWLIHYMIGTVSGGSISWGSKQTLTTGAFVNNNMQLCYRSADSKWFMIWNDSPDINYTCAGTWTSGTTMTWSLKAFTSADTYFWKGYNPEAQQLDDELPYVTVMSKDYSEYQRARIFTFKYDASSGHYIAASAPTIPFLPSGSTGLVNFTLSSSGQFGLSYSPDDGKYLWSGMTWAAPYYLQAGSYQPASGSDNSVTFIGIAQSTVTNGQSVDVKWLSSQDTQQSGLTIAAKAYADGTGAITSTVGTNTHIGFATTATDVIITETGSAFV